LLRLDVSGREQRRPAFQQVKRNRAKNHSEDKRGDPVMAMEKRVTHQKSESEYQHLNSQQAEHGGAYGVPGTLADIARDLRELDPGEIHLLTRDVGSILCHFTQQLTDAAIWRCA